jgi:hypothetical protein
MKSTSKTIKQVVHNVVRTHHLTKIHGQPNQAYLSNMIHKILAKLVDINISDTYGHHTADKAMNNFGCLAGIMTEDKYLQRTTLDWDKPTKPNYYNTNITNAMP